MGAKKKPVVKKKAAAAKKPAAKPVAQKKSAPKKSAPKKPAPKKPAPKKGAVPKKTAAKVTAKKSAVPKKTAAAKVTAKKSAAPKKTAAAKTVAKRPTAAPQSSQSSQSSRRTRTRTLIGVAPPPHMPRPADRPSERAMAVAAQRPKERPLTDEEREAMSKVAHTALAALETDGAPEVIVASIGIFVDEIRTGRRPEPKSQDVRLGLGVLWGEQVRAQVGWRWVHLSYPNGFASYALVPDDRAFACFPLNRLTELMNNGADGANTSVPLFDSIRVGVLPTRRNNAYLVIG